MTQLSDKAKRTVSELVKHIFEHSSESLEGITYQELAFRIGLLTKHGIGHGHGMSKILSDMGIGLNGISENWGVYIPMIQSLVINKKEGLPSDGMKEFWVNYTTLTPQEKKHKVRSEYQKISNFGGLWNKVLAELGLEPIKPEAPESQKLLRNFYGGESHQHAELKKYVSENPHLVGAEKGSAAFTEYSFPSSDTVDVLFQSSKCWVAVEVKSRVSDKSKQDYERGIYQCVKYRALLQAMHQDEKYSVPNDIKTVLLLETQLPKEYKQSAESLGIDVIEGVSIPIGID